MYNLSAWLPQHAREETPACKANTRQHALLLAGKGVGGGEAWRVGRVPTEESAGEDNKTSVGEERYGRRGSSVGSFLCGGGEGMYLTGSHALRIKQAQMARTGRKGMARSNRMGRFGQDVERALVRIGIRWVGSVGGKGGVSGEGRARGCVNALRHWHCLASASRPSSF